MLDHLVHLSLHKQILRHVYCCTTFPDRQSLKRKADDAMLIDLPSPPPDTKSVNMTGTEKAGHFVSRPGPVDNKTMLRTEIRLNRILQARIHIIRKRVAAAASCIAELTGGVAVVCVIQEGDLKLHGMYNALEGHPQLLFPKTAARRR